MFETTKNGDIKGVLNDWDMASYVELNNEIYSPTAKHRTGTIPFMARELLTKGTPGPPPHLYRHDLESFFYIIVWAAVHYSFKKKKRYPTCDELKR